MSPMPDEREWELLTPEPVVVVPKSTREAAEAERDEARERHAVAEARFRSCNRRAEAAEARIKHEVARAATAEDRIGELERKRKATAIQLRAAEAEQDEANRLAHEYVLDNEKAGEEVERLREALTAVAGYKHAPLIESLADAREVARAALSPREDA